MNSNLLNIPLFNIGDTQTTLGSLIVVIIIIVATEFVARLCRKTVERFYLKLHKSDIDASKTYGILAGLFIWFIGVELVLHLLGIRLSALFAASGFLALGAGFAAKNIIENFLSGGILRIEKTIRTNDIIIVKDKWLVVQHIGIRATRARTFDGEEILIPNSQITQSIVQNVTRTDRLRRLEVKVGVAYESDLALVRQTLEQVIENLEWRSNKEVSIVYLDEFGNSSVNYVVSVWLDEVGDIRIKKSDLHEKIWWALKANKITIAYPQLDLHIERNHDDKIVDKKT